VPAKPDVEMKDEENKVEHAEKEKDPNVDIEMVDSKKVGDEFKVIKKNPQPYVVCKSDDYEVVNLIEEREGVTLTVNKMKCIYMTS